MLRILLRQRPQQIGQTGADRHFAAEQLHAVTGTRFQRQMITLQMLAHLSHIVLQRRAADKPFISQIFQLQRESRRQKTHHQPVYPFLAGAWDAQQRIGLLRLQGVKACRVINFELITITPAEDKLCAVLGEQRV